MTLNKWLHEQASTLPSGLVGSASTDLTNMWPKCSTETAFVLKMQTLPSLALLPKTTDSVTSVVCLHWMWGIYIGCQKCYYINIRTWSILEEGWHILNEGRATPQAGTVDSIKRGKEGSQVSASICLFLCPYLPRFQRAPNVTMIDFILWARSHNKLHLWSAVQFCLSCERVTDTASLAIVNPDEKPAQGASNTLVKRDRASPSQSVDHSGLEANSLLSLTTWHRLHFNWHLRHQKLSLMG